MNTHDYSDDQPLTTQEIADWAGVSISTVRRKKPELETAGAYVGRPAWKITKRQATEVGLHADKSPSTHENSASTHTPPVEPDSSLVEALRDNIRSLENALEREQDRVASLERTLDQEKQEKMLWLQGYLSQTHQILPREDTGEDTQDDQPQEAPPTEPATRRKFSFRNLFRRT